MLTSRVLMLALDPTISVSEASTELVRYSLGDLDMLLDTADQVISIAEEHSGPDATRALEIVDAAIIRTESLRRHPTTPRAGGPGSAVRRFDIALGTDSDLGRVGR